MPSRPIDATEFNPIFEARALRRRGVCVCCAVALAAMASPMAAAAAYTGTITGSAANDGIGGSGGYNPGYFITSSNGVLDYAFGSNDGVSVETTQVADTYAAWVSAPNGASPVRLETTNASGTLGLSAIRHSVGSWGVAMGVSVIGSSVTIDGNTNVYAQSDDAVPNSASLGVRVESGAATFNGSTGIKTYTPGYSQGLWVYQSTVNFNGPTTVLAQARGTSTCGVYNSGGGRSLVNFNGDASISALAIYPSDNVHGIYNDNQNSQLNVQHNLVINAVAQGSTAFGIRNQGVIQAHGDSSITAQGPRSTFGVANTHTTARMTFGGNVDITVVNGTGYIPFGAPTGIGNTYAGSGYAYFDRAVHAQVSAASVAYALDNASTLKFRSASDVVSLSVSSSCTTCNVYGIHNVGGSVAAAGGLVIATSPSGSGIGYALWNVPAQDRDATIDVNAGGAQPVQIDGDIVSGSLVGSGSIVHSATTTIKLTAAASHLHGQVLGYQADATTYGVGATHLSFANAATWVVAGANTDFGDGSLALGAGGVIDLSQAPLGAFTLDSSSVQGAQLTLGDRATLRIASDITGVAGAASADRLNVGSGMRAFASTGALQIAIASDPLIGSGLLADTQAWTFHPASVPLVIADATLVADTNGRFAQATTLMSTFSAVVGGTTRIVRVRPQVTLSANGKQIGLAGLWIQVLPADTLLRDGFDDASG